MRASFAALLAGGLMAACGQTAQLPRPSGTLEPTITESSSRPTARPESSKACDLLTSEDREDLVHMSMDAELAVHPIAGTEECIWTHSLNEPARSAIRVIAVNGNAWARAAKTQILLAIAHPSTSKALKAKLKKALVEVSDGGEDLTDERICEIYLVFTESRGMTRSEDMLFAGTIGSLPAVYAASCDRGTILMAGYGEYALTGSIALNHAVFRLVEAANERAAEVLDDSGTTDPDDGAGPDDDTATDEDADPDADQEPPPTETDEGEPEDEEDES